MYVEPPKYFSYVPQHLNIFCIYWCLIFPIFVNQKIWEIQCSVFLCSWLRSIITLLHCTGDIVELCFCLAMVVLNPQRCRTYIAVKKMSPQWVKMCQKQKNSRKLLGILRVKNCFLMFPKTVNITSVRHFISAASLLYWTSKFQLFKLTSWEKDK